MGVPLVLELLVLAATLSLGQALVGAVVGVCNSSWVGGGGQVMCPSRVGQGLLPPFMVSVHRHEDACQDMQGRGQGRGTGRARGGTGQGRR